MAAATARPRPPAPPTAAEGGLTGSISIVGSEPQNPLVSVNTNETGGGNVLDAITTGLVTYNNETGAPENAVAESIETDDNVTYTIKIKGDQTFHDGTQVKAKNFVDAWNYGAYGPNAALNSYFFETIEGFADVQGEDKNGDDLVDESEATATEMSGLAVVDDTTFTVKLSSPASSFPVRLGYTAFVPLPDAFFADPEAFGEKPVGNGPYQLTEWQHDVKLVLDAYEDYNLADAASVQTVEYRVYANSDAAYADLLAGNVDIQPTLPTAALAGDQYKSDLGERVVEQAAGTIATLTFPPVDVDPRYDNPDLRLAISQAIDREAITTQIFNSSRIPADSFVSPVVDGYKSGNCGEACNFDPEAAKAAFAKAGGRSTAPSPSATTPMVTTRPGPRLPATRSRPRWAPPARPPRSSTSRPSAPPSAPARSRVCTGPAGRWTTRRSRTSSPRCTARAPVPTTASTPARSSTA